MREIKFRAWEETRKLMFMPNVIDLMIDFVGNIYSVDIGSYKPVNDLKIMQYTGLKDKNGKEIYEGDIVKGKNYGFNNPIRYIGTVEYAYNKFKVIGCRNKYKGTNDELSTIYEVIGNIYETPELLEGEKNE